MKNILSKKHFPQGHFSQASAQFKLNQCQLYVKQPERCHINKNATSAELGLTKQNKSQIKINQCKYESSFQDMMPKRDEIYKYRRRPSPSRNQSKKDLLTHSVDFIKPPHIERDSSFINFHKKTSQSGFYKRPQVSISLTRMKENEAANKIFDYSNKENMIYTLINNQIQRNPITGNGLPNQYKTGIKCNPSIRSQMDEILFQNRDQCGRKKWNIQL
ncbi:unnamed protein product [Paramecium pentaurelia]|uniref:Uncharacterized protein n=1 Tax=Paramecium pentaurelia TaxID=43138 RepID=A0A8S1VIW0_9CILI|nr:unnamed protein product [Paramecium pentaurelia]